MNPFATVVLAHLDTLQTREDQQERKDRKFRLVRSLYERGWDAEQIREMFRLIDWMVDLPEPLDTQFREEITQYEKENTCLNHNVSRTVRLTPGPQPGH